MPRKLIDALTDADVRSAKPTYREGVAFDRKLVDGRGLYLLVRVNQGAPTRHWRLKFRFAGRERLLALGEYPDVGLKAARERAAAARDLARQGIDPVQRKREDRLALETAALNTFEVVANQWMAKKSGKWTEGHLEQTQQSLRDYVLPKIGRRPVASLTAQDVARLLEPLEKAGKLETLRRVRQRVGAVLGFAALTGLRPDNPVRDLARAFESPVREHYPSIRPTGIPDLLDRLDRYRGDRNTVAIIRMMMWTACRTKELRLATAEEFDLEGARWTIPGNRMKKGRTHVVPLPSQAVTLLRELLEANKGARYVFHSPGKPDQEASEAIVNQALRKMGYKQGELTGHGVRAAVSTALEEWGFATELVKAQLSHAKATLTDAAYLRGVHVERRAEMMQQWADALESGALAGKVIPFRGGQKTAA